ncbi:MAG: 4-hydroxythreonine-4-phosphate dehydrogenase PdxA [Gemmatimonadales bacterium]|nr:MAG: 4-hydroxythreonine-4-phosphate dehydrogenase PdxA [Gemmatimonadales bacterium]
MSRGALRLAVTLGDPRGIGAETVLGAAVPFLREFPDYELVLLGAPESEGLPPPEGLPDRVRFQGTGAFDGSTRSAGAASLAALEAGVRRCLSGRAHGLVTAPVHKPALHAAGRDVPGQTELLQSLTGAPDVGMLMAAESSRLGVPIRILLATTHIPLRAVPHAVTGDRLARQARLLHHALRSGWQISRPRLALCGLNPHASDDGLFGDEEARILFPAAEGLREEGIEITDPLPADTVFLRLVDGRADAVVAPYHDVGMAVFKTLAFGHGVNTTLGLPFVRTSPDHGTAFDIAGTGKADPASTLAALRLAARMAARIHFPGTTPTGAADGPPSSPPHPPVS